MKRKHLILLSISLSVAAGSLTAFAVTKWTLPDLSQTIRYTDPKASAHFAASPGTPQGFLPDFTTAAEQAVEAVVNIEKRQKVTTPSYGGFSDPFELFFGTPQRQPQQQPQERRSGGSGVIISEDGYIVTNNHVVENASELIVTLHDGSIHKATTVGTDPATDIALIKIEAKGLKTLPFGNSDELKLGEWVLAIGNPYGLTSTVTAGIVSAKGRSLGVIPSQMGVESFIQTDAAVNAGNSGGALVTVDGQLVGINTVILSPTQSYAGYSFAVPSTIVRKVVTDLREYGVVQRALLGISYREINSAWIEERGEQTGIKTPGGMYIEEVAPGGAAEAAGIKKGDVLTHINGKAMQSQGDVQETIAKFRPNDKITITVKRGGDVKQIEVTLRNRAGKAELVSKESVDLAEELGGTFRPVTDKQKKELGIKSGLQVVSVNPGGVLAKAQIQRGFIITSINDQPVGDYNDLNRITDKPRSIDGLYPNGKSVSYRLVQ